MKGRKAVQEKGGKRGADMNMSPSPSKQKFGVGPLRVICCSWGCKTLRTDTAAHCKRKGVREEDWAALDLKTLLSGQEGPGIDASAISIRHQRRLTAERRS